MSDRDDRVGAAVAWYFQTAESGTPPDRAAFLARFPDLRPELESFLADKGAFDHAAGPPVRHPDPDPTVPPPSPNNDTATLPPATDPNATAARADSNPNAGPQPDPALASIRYFGDYELLSEIARGGMGVVFRARQMSLNREVALKMILTGQLASSADVIRFRAEAEAAANLDHPNILPIYEVGEHHGQQYFAMKLVPGGSLAGKVDACVDDPRAAVGVFVKVCRAVDFAHRRGILHRDLKPGNILLDRDGTPYVTDFGLAKKVDADSNLTQSGAIVGTPSYMAPEQARAEKGLTTAADVYALGAILYELLTGRPPFRGPTVLDTILQVIEKEPADPCMASPRADRDLAVIALKCLEKNPAKRYESAGALADDLDRWARGEPILARAVTRFERAVKWVRRNQVVTGLLLAVATALLVGATVGYLNFRDARTQEGIARAKAEDADREAAKAKEQEALAADRAADAKREADEAKRQQGIAQTETQRAKDAEKVSDARRKESLRLLDLTKLREAQSAFDNNLVQLARDTLADIAPEDRCLVWRLLKQRFEGCLFALRDHTGPVTSVAVSADGSRIVTGSFDKTVRVWDARTGDPLHELKGHTGQVTSVAVSADGSRIVSGAYDRTVRVWDARTGQFLRELTGFKQLVECVAVSPGGSRIVTGADNNTARVWDARTGNVLLELTGHKQRVASVAVSPDGSRIVTGAGDFMVGEVRVWDAQTGKPLFELKGHKQQVTSVAVSPDGTRIVTGSLDRTARVWDVRTGQVLLELKGHLGEVTSVAVSPDGSRIVTGSEDHLARVWDASTGQSLLELKGHTVGGLSVAVGPDGSRIVTGSWDGTVRVWEVPSARPEGFASTGQPFPELRGHQQQVTSVALSPDGSRIVTGSADGTARVWDGHTGQFLTELKGHGRQVSSVAVSADGSRIITGAGDVTVGEARVWDARTGYPLLELKGHTGKVLSVAVSPDGSRIVTGSLDRTARVWDIKTGQSLLELIGHTGFVSSVAVSPDGFRIVTGSYDQTARVWDAKSGQSLLELRGHQQQVTSVAVSPDGSRIVTGSHDQTARVWDGRTGQFLTELKGHGRQVSSVAVSADGSRIITGAGDGMVGGWDARTGQLLTMLKGHTRAVTSVALSPDGSRIVTGSTDGTARVWDASAGPSFPELEGHTARVLIAVVSADGARVVTGSADRTARVWDARTRRFLTELKGHTGWVTNVAVSADGSRVVTGSDDGTVRVWEVPSARPEGVANAGRSLTEFKGHAARVASVALSKDGFRVVSADWAGKQFVWEASTGNRLPDRPVPPVFANDNGTPDGDYRFVPEGVRVVRVPTRIEIDEDERLRRLWLTRPDPDRHAQRAKELVAEGNRYGAAVQRWAEHRARGTLALEAGDLDRAWGHFIVAAALKPAPPAPPPFVPPPPATITPAK